MRIILAIKRYIDNYYWKSEMYTFEDSYGKLSACFKYKKFIWSSWKYVFDYETSI